MFTSILRRLCRFELIPVIALGLTIAFVGPVNAQDQTGGVPGDWLSQYMGARTAGLAGSYVAIANDPMGVVWNPAGLSYMKQNEVYIEKEDVGLDFITTIPIALISDFQEELPHRRC